MSENFTNELWQRKIFGKKPEQKKYAGLKKVSDKKKKELAEIKKSGDSKLDEWFEHFMEVSEPVCEECGMRADWLKGAEYKQIWRACQAHVLPKKKNCGFPSLASNLDNHIVLFPSWGGHLCGCHGFYDSSWYNATTMNIWTKVVEIVKVKLIHLIPDSEKRFIPEQLLKAIG